MPDNAPQPPIIDLVDVIEQNASAPQPQRKAEDTLSSHVSDLIKTDNADEDIGLDDLLAQLNDGEEPAASARIVNPNERLNMPAMDDMDEMLGQFGSPPEDDSRNEEASARTASDDLDLDDLLADLDAPADKPKVKPAEDIKSVDDDLDDLLADLDAPEDKPTAKPAGDIKSVDDDLDDLLADLDSPPPAAVAPAPEQPRSGRNGTMLDNLLENLDVPPSGPITQSADTAEIDTRHVDALLDNAAGVNLAPAGGEDSIAPTSPTAPTVQIVDEALEILRKGMERSEQEIESLRAGIEKNEETAADTLARLQAVEKHCAGISQELAALRNRLDEMKDELEGRLAALEDGLAAPVPATLSQEQLDSVARHALSAMRAEIEKAAAASAAKVIREEISALFEASS